MRAIRFGAGITNWFAASCFIQSFLSRPRANPLSIWNDAPTKRLSPQARKAGGSNKIKSAAHGICIIGSVQPATDLCDQIMAEHQLVKQSVLKQTIKWK